MEPAGHRDGCSLGTCLLITQLLPWQHPHPKGNLGRPCPTVGLVTQDGRALLWPFNTHVENRRLDLELQQTVWSGATDNQHSPLSIEILATLVLETNRQCHPRGDLSHPTLSAPSPD